MIFTTSKHPKRWGQALHESPGRLYLYLGVAAPGRAMKAILLRIYVALLSAAQKHFDPAGVPEQAADAYMTLRATSTACASSAACAARQRWSPSCAWVRPS